MQRLDKIALRAMTPDQREAIKAISAASKRRTRQMSTLATAMRRRRDKIEREYEDRVSTARLALVGATGSR